MAGDDRESMNIEAVQAAAPEEDAAVVTQELAALGRIHRRVSTLEGESQKAKDQLAKELEEARNKPGVSCQVLNFVVVWIFLIAAFCMAAYAVYSTYAIPHYKSHVNGSWNGSATTVSATGVLSTTTHTVVLTQGLNNTISGTVDEHAVIGMVGWSHETEAFSGEITLVGTAGTSWYTAHLTGRNVLYLTEVVMTTSSTTLAKMALTSMISGDADNDTVEITAILAIVCSVLLIGAGVFAVFKMKLNVDDPEKCLYPACTPALNCC